MKRNLIILLVVAVAIVAGFLYFSKNEVVFTKETSMYKAVPLSSPLFIEFNSIKSFPLDNQIVKELESIGFVNTHLDWIEQIDTLIVNEKNIHNGIRNEAYVIAFGFSGNSELFPVLIKKSDSNSKRNSLESLLKTLYKPGVFVYENRNYSGHEIVTILNQNQVIVHYCFVDGLFVASSKAILVEQSVRQLSSTTILNDHNFSKVNRTVTSQAESSVYINHAYFPDLLGGWLNSKTVRIENEFEETVQKNYKNDVQRFRDFAIWSELDVDFDDLKISLNGISVSGDSTNNFLSVFNNQEAVKFKADEILPNNTSAFLSFSFSEKKSFFNNLETYFTHSENYYKREEQIKKMELNFRANLKSVFQQITNNEIIVATTNVPVRPSKKTTLFIIHTEGESAAKDQLYAIIENYAGRKQIDLNSLKSNYSVDKETNFEIIEFPFPSFPGIWMGKPFGLAEANFCTFYKNFLVFSNSKEGLEEYLHNMVLETTLAKDIRYIKFKEDVSARSNINFYVNINRAFSLKDELFNSEVLKQISENEETFRKIQGINWQVIRDKEMYFNSVILSFDSQAQEEAKTTWQSNIGNEISLKPQIFVNHTNPASREVVFQDENNNLCQVTSEGRVRWSVSIPESIMSEIFQVDYYKNGNLQYLFNTKNKLYLLDRNGNNVAHFPVAFRSPATNGVNVFDYDNNRSYRYFVACEDKKVYAYDYSGKLISGWEFEHTDHLVTTPVQHFRVENKDYIVFKDKLKVYIQDRRGNTRVATRAKFENSENPLFLNLNGKAKIVATDKNGKVFYLFFDGSFEEKGKGNFSENHFFSISDINGNGIPDFIFVDGKELQVMDENGKKLYSEKFKNLINSKPNLYSFSSNSKKVGITDAIANRIYLFNPDGTLHDGFPLQGNSEFSIGKIIQSSTSLNLIVGSEGGSLFNYTLN